MSSLGIFNKETKTYQKVAGTAEAVVLDTAMSDTSENPVQNKVVTEYIDARKSSVGQNLIPYPYYRPNSYTTNGITWTVNEDGSITANGRATATAFYAIFVGQLGLEIGKSYVLTLISVGGPISLYIANVNKQNHNTDLAVCSRVNNSTVGVIFNYSQVNDFDHDAIALYVETGTTLTNCVVKFQLERGTLRHEYQPTTLSNPTLKKKIENALQPESIVNNQTTTVEGFALDARQANPNIDGSLAKQISDLNGRLSNGINALNPSAGIKLFTDFHIGELGAGWYRIAEIISSREASAQGSSSEFIEILINQSYGNQVGCFHKVKIVLVYADEAKISSLGNGVLNLTKVRVVRKSNNLYFDVFSRGYNNSTRTLLNIPLYENIVSAKAYSDVKIVPETADGEVIVCSVDLADNI